MSKKPIKKWRGVSPHRYADNPLEKKLALAWEKLNKVRSGSAIGHPLDYLLDVTNKGDPPATEEQRVAANTVIQWLGSPVGFEWLVNTVGLEVTAEVLRRGEDYEEPQQRVRPAQVYQSTAVRDDGRQIVVEARRYAPGDPCYRTGPFCRWRVRNRVTGRRSYIKEECLLDGSLWRLV